MELNDLYIVTHFGSEWTLIQFICKSHLEISHILSLFTILPFLNHVN